MAAIYPLLLTKKLNNHQKMENEFSQVMSERTDDELIKIVTAERDKYNPIALEAADAEIEKRNIDTATFETIKELAQIQKVHKQKVDSNAVSSGIRFVNFLADFVIWMFMAVIVIFLVGLIVEPATQGVVSVFGWLFLLLSYLGYYCFMEIKFQKTIGKFITRTKVVRMDGEKPSDSDIIVRTFCRLIPFDRLSFLFAKHGFHDLLSKTTVVKDKMKLNIYANED